MSAASGSSCIASYRFEDRQCMRVGLDTSTGTDNVAAVSGLFFLGGEYILGYFVQSMCVKYV